MRTLGRRSSSNRARLSGRCDDGDGDGGFRPSDSWLDTHWSATIAEPSDSSPHSTVAATISASLRTLPGP